MDEKAKNRKKSELLMASKDSIFADVLGAVTIIIQSVIPEFIVLISYRTCADCGFIIGEGLVKANSALGIFICL